MARYALIANGINPRGNISSSFYGATKAPFASGPRRIGSSPFIGNPSRTFTDPVTGRIKTLRSLTGDITPPVDGNLGINYPWEKGYSGGGQGGWHDWDRK